MADMTNQQVLEGVTELIGQLADAMVTKDEFKQELKRFATKGDLKAFATKTDLDHMEARLTHKLDSHKKTDVQRHLLIRQEIGHLNRKFDNLRADLLATGRPT